MSFTGPELALTLVVLRTSCLTYYIIFLGCSQRIFLVEKPNPSHICGCTAILNMPKQTWYAACEAKAKEIGAGCFNYRYAYGACTLRMCNSIDLQMRNYSGNGPIENGWQYQIYSGLSSCSFELP